MTDQKPKIFLSYAREDMSMAKQLYSDLERYGLDVWLDTELLLPGDPWKDKIQDAIENSNYFIALLSTRSVNKKGFVQKRWRCWICFPARSGLSCLSGWMIVRFVKEN